MPIPVIYTDGSYFNRIKAGLNYVVFSAVERSSGLTMFNLPQTVKIGSEFNIRARCIISGEPFGEILKATCFAFTNVDDDRYSYTATFIHFNLVIN